MSLDSTQNYVLDGSTKPSVVQAPGSSHSNSGSQQRTSFTQKVRTFGSDITNMLCFPRNLSRQSNKGSQQIQVPVISAQSVV